MRVSGPAAALAAAVLLVSGCATASAPAAPAQVRTTPTAVRAPSTASPSPPPAVPSAEPVSRYPTPPGQVHRKLLEFTTGHQPKQVAFSPDGAELWVTPLDSAQGVEVYDARTGTRTHRVDLGAHGAVEIIFTRDGRTAYVSQMETASVFAIDTATHRQVRRYSTEGVWTKVLALSPDERTLYASNWVSNDVSAITLATGAVRRYPTVRAPRGLFVTPDGASLYVAGFASGQIEKLDLASGRGTTLVTTGGAMRHLVGDVKRGRLYANDMAGDRVYAVDLATDAVRELAATDDLPNTTDLSPDGRVLYVANRGRNGTSYLQKGPEWGSVLALDALTGAPLDAIVGGNQTTALDVSPDGTRLAFSDFLDSRVRIYAIPPYAELAAAGGGYTKGHRAALEKPAGVD